MHSTVHRGRVIVGRLFRDRRRRRRRRRLLAEVLDDLVVQPPVVVVVLRAASLRPPSAVVRRLRGRRGDGGPRPDVGQLRQHQRHQQNVGQRQPQRDDARRELCTPVHGLRRDRPASAPPPQPPPPPMTTKVIVGSHRCGAVGWPMNTRRHYRELAMVIVMAYLFDSDKRERTPKFARQTYGFRARKKKIVRKRAFLLRWSKNKRERERLYRAIDDGTGTTGTGPARSPTVAFKNRSLALSLMITRHDDSRVRHESVSAIMFFHPNVSVRWAPSKSKIFLFLRCAPLPTFYF